MLQLFKRKKKIPNIKILFAGHDFKFALLIINYFNNIEGFDVKIDKWKGHNIHDTSKSFKLLAWADIIFCEWCLGNAVWYSNNVMKNQKLYIRLHRQETTTSFPEKVNWKSVENLIFIAPKVKEIVEIKIPECKDNSTIIYNYVDYNKFNRPKIDDNIYNIGLLGMLPAIKRADISLDIINKLVGKDKRYKLYIKGKKPEDLSWLWKRDDERLYYEKLYKSIEKNNLSENVIFESYGDDVAQWFRKIGYIISCSDVEGSHQAIAEGMASGSIPMITGGYYKEYGATMMYPQKYMNEDIDEIIKKINRFEKNCSLRNKEINYSQKFVQNNFEINKIIVKYEDLFIRNITPNITSNYGIIKSAV